MIKKIFKFILVIFIIALTLIIIKTAQKVSIIDKFMKKAQEYQNVTNFYAKIQDDFGTREIWRKDEKGITKDILNEGTSITYVNGEELWNMMNTKDGDGNETKTAYKSQITQEDESAFLPVIENSDCFEIEDNLWEKIKLSFMVKISIEDVDGKECYKIQTKDGTQIYIKRLDFMKIKEVNSDITTQLMDYKLNSVEDSDVAMPNLEGYEVVEN